MKKKLNTDIIANELRGSVFFPQKETNPTPPLTQQREPQPEQERLSSQEQTAFPEDQEVTYARDDMQASVRASVHASKHTSTLATGMDLETIRKTLKLVGKEVLYVRLTPQEKKQVSDIEYTYQQQGIKTSSNEIGRIGINFLLVDYQVNGEQSILAKLLAALHT